VDGDAAVMAGGGLGRGGVVKELVEEFVDELGCSASGRLGQAGDDDHAFALSGQPEVVAAAGPVAGGGGSHLGPGGDERQLGFVTGRASSHDRFLVVT
jgi:hypothetical protein